LVDHCNSPDRCIYRDLFLCSSLSVTGTIKRPVNRVEESREKRRSLPGVSGAGQSSLSGLLLARHQWPTFQIRAV
jgi:hypothetical protein